MVGNSIVNNYYTRKTLHIGELYYLLDTKFNECNNNKRGMYITYYKSNYKQNYKSNDSGTFENLIVPRSLFLDDEKNGGIYAVPIVILVRGDISICHYNMLIINFGKRTIERFEPVNSYHYKNLDKLLQMCFCERGYKYKMSQNDGPQYFEMSEIGKTLNCGYWVLYFLDFRLKNKTLSFDKVMEKCKLMLLENGAHNTMRKYKDILTNYLKQNIKRVVYYKSRTNYEFYNRRLLDYYMYKC
jgi:hypothetical protein